MDGWRNFVWSRLPEGWRSRVTEAHRRYIFRRGMRGFLRDPAACARADSPVLADLVRGWGNERWSAWSEYLAACIRHALATPGPILECGSGLSTLVLGTIAQRRGIGHWALEHTPEWATRVQAGLDRYGLDSVLPPAKPLRDHGAFCWYDVDTAALPAAFALVVCDGPPGATRGGRYGLVPVLGSRLGPGCVILLDDAHRAEERDIAQRWAVELGATLEISGTAKPFVEIRVAGRAPPA